jgi:hypothetical protein
MANQHKNKNSEITKHIGIYTQKRLFPSNSIAVANIPDTMRPTFIAMGYKTDVKVNYPGMIFIILTITNF